MNKLSLALSVVAAPALLAGCLATAPTVTTGGQTAPANKPVTSASTPAASSNAAVASTPVASAKPATITVGDESCKSKMNRTGFMASAGAMFASATGINNECFKITLKSANDASKILEVVAKISSENCGVGSTELGQGASTAGNAALGRLQGLAGTATTAAAGRVTGNITGVPSVGNAVRIQGTRAGAAATTATQSATTTISGRTVSDDKTCAADQANIGRTVGAALKDLSSSWATTYPKDVTTISIGASFDLTKYVQLNNDIIALTKQAVAAPAPAKR